MFAAPTAVADPHAQVGVPATNLATGMDAQARSDGLYRVAWLLGVKTYTGCWFTANCDSSAMLSGVGIAPALETGREGGFGYSAFVRSEFSVLGRVRWEFGGWKVPTRSEAYASLGWEIFGFGMSYETQRKRVSGFAALKSPVLFF